MILRPNVAFLCLGFLATVAIFTEPARAQSSNVGVVDIAEVFKAHVRFNAELDAMKQDVEMFKAHLQREQDRLTQMAEEAQRFDPSSADFKERESAISSEAARLDLFRNQQNREFLEREARLYFDTYVAVSRELNDLSNEVGLTLILRVDNKEADPADRDSVLRVVNRNIVYKRPDRDYTAMLIERVNR